MTGMLDPVGPEDTRTYWIRRGVVGAALLIIVVLVIIAVTSMNGGGATTGSPTVPSGPSLQPASSTPEAPPSSATSSAATAPATPGASTPGGATTPAKPSTSLTSSPKPSTPAKPTTPAPPTPPAACEPTKLRTTLGGPREVKVGTPVTFEAGVINGGTTACTFTLDPLSYEFRIYSGTDRIWTTKGCAAWVPKVSTVLAPEKAVTWKIQWTVQRSKDCGFTKDQLRPGTYAANSLLSGADAAQLVMQLRS